MASLASKKSPRKKKEKKKETGGVELSFREQQALQRRERKEKRVAKQKCYVCGERGHSRRECPGILDGGKGQSIYRSNKQKREGGHGSKGSARGQKKKTSGRHRGDSDGSSFDDSSALPTSEVPFVDVATNLYALLMRAGKQTNDPIHSACVTDFPENLTAIVGTLSTREQMSMAFNNSGSCHGLFYIAGVHPSASDYDRDGASILEELNTSLSREDVLACGPIGIDYSTRCVVDRDLQLDSFISQVKLAVAADVPLVIWLRPDVRQTENYKQALKDMLVVLQEHVPVNHRICLHAFAGAADAGVVLLKAFPNLYISFSSIITFNKAKHLREMAFDVPMNRCLLCSDGPDLPVSQIANTSKKALSEPGHLLFIADAIAKEKNVGLDEVLICALENSCSFFDYPFAKIPERLPTLTQTEKDADEKTMETVLAEFDEEDERDDEEAYAIAAETLALNTDCWACSACTFLNDNPAKAACGMCGTERELDVFELPEGV